MTFFILVVRSPMDGPYFVATFSGRLEELTFVSSTVQILENVL